MKRLLIIVLCVLFGLFSCQRGKGVKPLFNYIDFTYGNGWAKRISVHLENTKIINIRLDEPNKRVLYFCDTLSDSLFHNINLLSAVILKNKYDSVNSIAGDCSYYNIVMESSDKKINSIVYCPEINHTSLDTLVFKILRVSNNIRKVSGDTTFNFKSYLRVAPPIHDSVKFIKPTIEEYNSKKQ